VLPALPTGATLKLELLGEVLSDPAVRDAVLRRQLIVEAMPGCPAAVAIGALATRLLA
jgi:flagellar biosynthesis protein FlhG